METILQFLVPAIVVVGLLLWKRSGQISPDDAKRLLQDGAKVIDVRTPAEFSSTHLRNALNIPLAQLKEQISRAVPDKTTPLLLYCHSGGRSALARARLKSMGFEQVYNLGSLGRARRIVAG